MAPDKMNQFEYTKRPTKPECCSFDIWPRSEWGEREKIEIELNCENKKICSDARLKRQSRPGK